jgi:hypothetical protein
MKRQEEVRQTLTSLDMSIVETDRLVNFVEDLAIRIDKGECVYVHCWVCKRNL